MKRPLVLPVLLALGLTAPARGIAQIKPGVLDFEASRPGSGLVGWQATPSGVFLDSVVVHGGRYAARLVKPPTGTAILALSLPVKFSGDSLELRGWLKTDTVIGFVGLWMREDGSSGPVAFDNMRRQNIDGTRDWAEYDIRLPLDRRARSVSLGVLLAGEGTAWADDLELLVDGKPVSEAPARRPAPAQLDTAFDHGSGIHTQALSRVQVDNLALLGKVWGFVKYHDPRVVAGDVNWDFELFRIMPAVLQAPDRAAADRAMAAWLARLGDPPPCAPCATLPTGAYMLPDVAWIRDKSALGDELSRRLELIYHRRSTAAEQYYVSMMVGVQNPDFSTEEIYGNMPTPDAGFRLLALYRLWNIVEYWYPNRDVVGGDWNSVLAEFVPRLMAASGHDPYRLAMMQLIARIHDTHANLWSDIGVRPPEGTAQLPVVVRFVQGKAVVTGYSQPTLGPAGGLRVGDVIDAIDGASVDSLVKAWRPYYADSNEAARLRDMGRTLTRGPAGPVRVQGKRAGGTFVLTARRIPRDSVDVMAGIRHDLPGPAFRMLTPEVAYLKLSTVKNADMTDYLVRAANAKVLVIDIRDYPDEFVVFTLGGHLVTKPTPFARFTHGDMANPGAFEWTDPVVLQPLEPHFAGKVVVLVDATTQSSAEYTAMAFRAAGATVVGSTTAGADGNVSIIPLPGGLRTMVSGIGVFYPDKKPTQRVGIVPDVVVRPTLAGIRAGRDEVLDSAVSLALGHPFTLKR